MTTNRDSVNAIASSSAGGAGGASFTENLDAEAMAYFNEVSHSIFSAQTVAFLNAYWPEVNSQAEFIYSFSYQTMRKVDQDSKGISLVHMYNDGVDVDFDMVRPVDS